MAKKKVVTRPKKIKKPFVIAQGMAKAKLITYSQHAIERMIERDIDKSDVAHVVSTGIHQPKGDRYEVSEGWSYCFEGMDLDQERTLRIIVALKSRVYVVTAIEIAGSKYGYN